MERIFYSGDEILTGTDIAHALVGYARALASTGGSDAVTIPTYHADGSRGSAEFLVGPASQLVAESIDSPFEELIDTDLVERLQRLSRMTQTAQPIASNEADIDQLSVLDDPL